MEIIKLSLMFAEILHQEVNFFKPILLNELNINVDRTLLLSFLAGLVLRVPGKLLSSGFSGPVFFPEIPINIRGTWSDSDPQTCLPQQRWSLWVRGRRPASLTCSPSLWTPPKCDYRWAHLAQTQCFVWKVEIMTHLFPGRSKESAKQRRERLLWNIEGCLAPSPPWCGPRGPGVCTVAWWRDSRDRWASPPSESASTTLWSSSTPEALIVSVDEHVLMVCLGFLQQQDLTFTPISSLRYRHRHQAAGRLYHRCHGSGSGSANRCG